MSVQNLKKKLKIIIPGVYICRISWVIFSNFSHILFHGERICETMGWNRCFGTPLQIKEH